MGDSSSWKLGRTPAQACKWIALVFFKLGTRWGWVVNATPWPLYHERDPVPIVQKAGCAPGPVWVSAKNLAPTRIRSPDCPARSESLYLLNYPSPCFPYADTIPATKSLTRLDTVSVGKLLVSKRWCFLNKVFTLPSPCIPSRTHHP
jgi:hypothetical protein